MKSTKLFCLIIFIILFSNISAQKHYSKSIHKAFLASRTNTLKLENIYGNVRIVQTNKDSLSLDIKISMAQYDKKKAEKQLEEIKIIFGYYKNKSTAKTSITKQFNTAYKFSIDYIVSVPAGIDLIIKNSFGNIIAEGDLNNYAEFSVNYGNIYVDNLIPQGNGRMNYFKINYSTAHLKHINNSKILTNFSKIRIKQANDIIISSRCSRIEVDSTYSYISNSQYDNLFIKKCSSFTIKKGEKSHIRIENGIKNADINLRAGTLSIKDISSFENILLSTINSNVDLNISKQFNYSLKAELDNTKYTLPLELNYLSHKKALDNDEKEIIDAIYGEKNEEIIPCLLINAKEGFINIK
jgi:hypothetical protein